MFVLFWCANSESFAKTFTGIVNDIDGFPLIGANVVEDGTYNGTITDVNGNFTLRVASENAKITISYTGFIQQTLDFSSDQLAVVLLEGTALDEVVVTGSRGKPRTILGECCAY